MTLSVHCYVNGSGLQIHFKYTYITYTFQLSGISDVLCDVCHWQYTGNTLTFHWQCTDNTLAIHHPRPKVKCCRLMVLLNEFCYFDCCFEFRVVMPLYNAYELHSYTQFRIPPTHHLALQIASMPFAIQNKNRRYLLPLLRSKN